jgi:tRNA-Thr(GGU) m(6)t(6)A37 methyltransferase TsaA
MALHAIGRIRTPWQNLNECPRNITVDGETCTLEIDPRLSEGLTGLKAGDKIALLYWLDRANCDRLQRPSRRTGEIKGVFALRTPHRPNPIGLASIEIIAIDGTHISVRGLDCLDGTILLDIKPQNGASSGQQPSLD